MLPVIDVKLFKVRVRGGSIFEARAYRQGRALPIRKACFVSETVEGDFVRQHGRTNLSAIFHSLREICEKAALVYLGVKPQTVFSIS